MSGTKRYWLSWIQPTDDHRPLTYPPNRAILGWWCSGDTSKGSVLCGLVEAADDAAAKAAVLTDWPEATAWRFCEEHEPDFRPGTRFPLSNWMLERVEARRT